MNRKKKFLLIWGFWDRNGNLYDPTYRRKGIDFFTEDNGYTETDLEAIHELEYGQKYECESGNHLILRLA